MATRPTRKAAPSDKKPEPSFERITVSLPPEVAELARTAAYWSPGQTIASIVAAGIRAEVARLERKRGEPFPKRRGPVRAGRPVGS